MKIAFALIALLLITCREDVFYEGDFFYLVSKQAQMPVAVRGKTSSGIFLIFLHGGPGGTALQKIGLPAFLDLESSYATVFWDQRGSGSSQGNTSNALYTVDQFSEDLDNLVDVLRAKYNNPKIFLVGHSWGGCLGTAYLTDTKRQDKIQGWIEVDGAHNNPMADSLSMAFVIGYANQQITLHQDEDFWQYVLDWYAANPDFTSDQIEHYSFVEKAHGYIYDETLQETQKFPNYSFNYIFDSPANVTAALTNYNHVIKNFIISDVDLTAEMSNIKLPSLIIWGVHDGEIPFPMADQALNALGTPPENKSIVALPNSAHEGFYEEPVAFANAVRTFIEKYK